MTNALAGSTGTPAETFTLNYPGLAGADDETAQVLRMSALNEEGVMAVRSAACDRLLASRVDLKLKVRSIVCHAALFCHHGVCACRPGTLETVALYIC